MSVGNRHSGDNLVNRPTKIPLQPLPPRHHQLPRIQSHLLQQRGMDIGDVVAVFYGVKPQLVGGAMGDTATNASSGTSTCLGMNSFPRGVG